MGKRKSADPIKSSSGCVNENSSDENEVSTGCVREIFPDKNDLSMGYTSEAPHIKKIKPARDV